ncbi:MAG: hypothetical protein GYA33_05035 [Thermogutta sp.]|nr:hypothetical protein [Thermogutta sp.]
MTRIAVRNCVAVAAVALIAGHALAENTTSYTVQEVRNDAEMLKAHAMFIQAQAAMVKAIADARVQQAQVAKTMTEVQAMRMDNALKHTKTFYERRQARDTYFALRQTPSPGDSKHPVQPAAMTVQRPMYRLTVAEFDPVTKVIHWPDRLRSDRYAGVRNEIEAIFAAQQAGDCGAGSVFFAKVKTATDRMADLLRAEVRQMSPAEYVAAKRFLEGLRNEALAPAAVNQVAMNGN